MSTLTQMSALGQNATSHDVRVTSALPPKADIPCGERDVRSARGWPNLAIARAAISLSKSAQRITGLSGFLRVVRRFSSEAANSRVRASTLSNKRTIERPSPRSSRLACPLAPARGALLCRKVSELKCAYRDVTDHDRLLSRGKKL